MIKLLHDFDHAELDSYLVSHLPNFWGLIRSYGSVVDSRTQPIKLHQETGHMSCAQNPWQVAAKRTSGCSRIPSHASLSPNQCAGP